MSKTTIFGADLRMVSVLERPAVHDGIEKHGFAVRVYPRYVNLTRSLHGVDCVLLSFIRRGRGRHYLGDEQYVESGGSISVVHYGQVHDIVTDTEGMEVINVFLDLARHPLPPVPPELRGVLADILPLHPGFQNRLNRMVRLQFTDPEPAVAHLLAADREQCSTEPGHDDAARLHFSLFLIACCRQALATGIAVASAPGRVPASVAALETVRRRLDVAFAQEDDLPALARLAGMAPQSLCRAFKRYTGKTISEYRVHRRMQEAAVRLRGGGGDKILGIALECGFHDLAYFNRTFKQLFGCTPRTYRDQSFNSQ